MKQDLENKTKYFSPARTLMIMVIIFCIIAISSLAFKNINDFENGTINFDMSKDSVASAKAFLEVYKVLMSPRCMNCHPSGDQPLQGDDSHIHTMVVQRGKDGKGLYAAKCSNCHQPENAAGLHAPPGNPKWQLPPANMKMVFQDRTAHDLALQIVDYKRNGNKNKKQLLEHARDTLVKAAWNMGEGRKPPPLSYKEFLTAWDEWINKGGVAPK